ncbi:MAG TPA: histidine phosphatase family protein [Geminicoccaceae bacterium]
MPTLLLLRHAKSSWADPALDDHARPLAGRGRQAAARTGDWMRARQLRPDLVLCSTAARARETFDLLGPRLGASPPLRPLKSLYLAEPERLLQIVRRAPDDAGCLMLIGHNPGLQRFALLLVGEGRARDLRRMTRKFPTAALARISFPGRGWREIGPGTGTLEALVRPKDLD